VYAAAAADVRHVMIHGRWVMQERQMLTLDEDEVKADVQRIAGEVRRKLL
jgi:5-methylthioadenosine/S-adenosylhomocysteine deaminase